MSFSTPALNQRFRTSAPLALRHLLLSAAIAALVAWLVLGFWFPPPFAEISGGLTLFLWIVGVDVVCGPALTLVLLHPGKSRKAIWVDITLIAVVQLSALAYGLDTLKEARPLAIVFEVDRFHVVSHADLDMSRAEAVPDWVRPWGFAAPRLLGVRSARTSQEKFESVDASLQGIEPGQRPDWWQDYDINAPEVKRRAKRLEALLALHPQETERIQSAVAQATKGTQIRPEDLLWLPVVSRQSMDWVAFLDPADARIRGFAHVDGFGS